MNLLRVLTKDKPRDPMWEAEHLKSYYSSDKWQQVLIRKNFGADVVIKVTREQNKKDDIQITANGAISLEYKDLVDILEAVNEASNLMESKSSLT